MDYTATGTVTFFLNEYFECPDFSNLRVHAYAVGYNTISSSLSNTTVSPIATDPDTGAFSFVFTTSQKAFLLRLYQIIDETPVLLAESPLFCKDDILNYSFNISMTSAGGTIYQRVYDAIEGIFTAPDTPESILPALLLESSLDAEATSAADRIKEISCISCIKTPTVYNLRNALKLWEDFENFYSALGSTPLYLNARSGAEIFESDSTLGKSIFFALGTQFKTLQAALSHSRTQFNMLLVTAVNRNIISDTILTTVLDEDDNEILVATDTILNALEGARDLLLFNSNNDGAYYAAKLIHLSNNTVEAQTVKRSILNSCLDTGLDKTLSQHSGETDYDNVARLKRISEHLQNFITFLVVAITEPDVIAENYFALTFDASREYNGPLYWFNLMPAPEPGNPYNPAYSGDNANLDYAYAIYKSIAENHPTAQVLFKLDTSNVPEKESLLTDLSANPNFNINEHGVESFFGGSLSETAKERILKLQRSLRLTGEHVYLTGDGSTSFTEGAELRATARLMNNASFTVGEGEPVFDLTTSLGITNLGKGQFLDLMVGSAASGGVTEGFAGKIYCQAKAIQQASVSAVAEAYLYGEVGGSSHVPHVLNVNTLDFPDDTFGGELPDMESLFGSFDTCTCSECQSVYSPAAYLTDLLNWLKKDILAPGSSTSTGLDALKKQTFPGPILKNRREDIVYLLLHCENTNTVLPYIDIVNEILAMNMSVPTVSDFQALQTTKTAEELLTEPEHHALFETNKNLLKGLFFDWTLPYNEPFDEIISITKGIGKPYHELVRDFNKPSDQYNSLTWALSYLGINPEEATIITSSHSSTTLWVDYWGIDSIDITFPSPPQKIGPFLTASKLEITELEDFLDAYYINQTGGKITLDPAPDSCDVDNYTFHTFSDGAGDRLMRFIRLKRRTSLSIWELDVAIKQLSPSTGIDQAFIIKLASAKLFSEKFNISFGDLLVWLGDSAYINPIDNSASEYFIDKFRNPVFPDELRTFFTSTYSSVTLATLTNKYKQFLCKTLKTSIPRLEKIISYLTSAPTSLSSSTSISAALSKLDRYSSFIETFEIETEEIDNILRLIDDPLRAADILKASWDFSSTLIQLSDLNVSLTTLKDIIEGDNDYSIASLDSAAKNLWTNVEKAYQEDRKANPDIVFSGTPSLPSGVDLTTYRELIVTNINFEFNMGVVNIQNIINESFPTFIDDFLSDPDSIREWGTTNIVFGSTLSVAFTPVYRLLKTMVLMAEISGLDENGISSGVEIEINNSLSISSASPSPFFWFKDTFPTISTARINDIIWIKKANDQANDLGLDQSPNGYYSFLDDYYTNNASTYTSGNSSKIITLYNSLGSASDYVKLSVHEFTETFLRAKAIAGTASDLVSVLTTMNTILEATKKVNISPIEGWAWVWSSWSGTFTEATIDYTLSADVRRAFKAKFNSFSGWSDAIVPIQNELRMRLRDALVAQYLTMTAFEDENKLYDYFLLDTQMAPCTLTTRIVSAISSTQLLIHRSLMKQEQYILLDEVDKKEWEWRKNYRVWEANRKVFLYPENWIDPSLRKEKTDLFKAAEEVLQQDEINDDNCEAAYADYLTGLNEISSLDIRAIYVEDPRASSPKSYTNNPDETYHVFGRTWNAPYKYFYRKFTQGKWLGWQKIETEIESDHLIPIMFNRKLYVFFPVFTEKLFANPKNSGDTQKDYKKYVNENSKKPYYEVQMAYTKLDFGKWSQKKIVKGTLYAGSRAFARPDYNSPDRINYLVSDSFGNTNPQYPNSMIHDWPGGDFFDVSMKKQDFYFWAENRDDGNLHIHCYRALDPLKRYSSKPGTYTEFANECTFQINPIDETAELISAAQEIYDNYGVTQSDQTTKRRYLARPYMTQPYYQQMRWGKSVYNKNSIDPEIIDQPQGGTDLFSADFKMYVKTAANDGALTPSKPLIDFVNAYTLTYPQQYKHSSMGPPFFFYDGYRNYFFRYAGQPISGQANTPPSNTN